MKKIAIVTVNFNTAEDTKELLISLANADISDFDVDIIIVDNGSVKPFMIEKDNAKWMVIRSETNTGFTGGNNIGIRKALDLGADYILLINNDTLVDPLFIKTMVKTLDKEDTIGATVPKIYFTKGREFHKNKYKQDDLGKVFWYAGGFIDWGNIMSIHRGVDEIDHGQYDKSEPVDFASGCCILLKSNVLKKIGLFNDKYFLYFEDADLSERIRNAGYTIYYVPDAKIYHKNATSSGGAGNDMQDYFITRNQMLFGMRYAPNKSKLALLRQSLRYLTNGRPNQKKGIKDYFLGKYGKGSYFGK